MTDRERLIHLLCNVDCNGADRRDGGCSFRQDSRCNVIRKLDMCMVETIADHLLANGVIVPPCKVGDKAYYLTTVDTLTELGVAEIFEGNIFSVTNDLTDMWIFCRYSNGLTYYHKESDIGKTVFLTREEAEKALSERSET